MTVGEMILEVYNQLGRPTDIRPLVGDVVSLESAGAQTILSWLNRGYRRILMWRFPNGRIIRFRTTERTLFFRSGIVEGDVLAGSPVEATLAPPAGGEAGRYTGWVIEITGGPGVGERRRIIEYTLGSVAIVHKPWDVEPDATSTYRLYRDFFYFVGIGDPAASEHIVVQGGPGIMSVLALQDVDTGNRLVRANRTLLYANAGLRPGTPSSFTEFEDRLVLDALLAEERTYELRYHGFPMPFATLNEAPQIPGHFHEGIVLWAVWWGLRRLQEFGGAYSTKKDLEDFMASALGQWDLAADRHDLSLVIGG